MIETMKRHLSKTAYGVALAAAVGLALAAAADFEVTAPDGRRILLKDDGTWQYVDAKGKEQPKEQAKEPAKEKPKFVGEAVLSLERREERAGGCAFGLRLVNNFPHPIQSLVPTFSAIRSNGVTYDSVVSGFQSLKPGDTQSREIRFRGISCQDIARLQVSGGDRCTMGDLDRFSFGEGECLARVRVVASDLVRFDKQVEEPIIPREGAEKGKGGPGATTAPNAPGQSK
jgi:hypothetical protein